MGFKSGYCENHVNTLHVIPVFIKSVQPTRCPIRENYH